LPITQFSLPVQKPSPRPSAGNISVRSRSGLSLPAAVSRILLRLTARVRKGAKKVRSGASSFSVDDSGRAFGVENHRTLNVYEILRAVNPRAVSGVLYHGDAALRDLAEEVLEELNGQD
jgi:hypothetical protein